MGLFDPVVNFLSGTADAVEEVVDTVADTVEDVVDTIEEVAETVVEGGNDAACNTGISGLCPAANVSGGIVIGIFHAVAGLVGHGSNIIRGIGRIIGSLLRGNWAGIWNAFLDVLVAVVLFVVDVVRIVLLAPIAVSIYDLSNRAALRQFISSRIDSLFGSDPERVSELRATVGLDGQWRWGLNIPAHHHVLFMDSANTPIWQMHEQGILNLYELAGYSDGFHKSARTVVRGVDGIGRDELFNITRNQIQTYLDRQDKLGDLVDQLRVYSISNRAAAENMATARKKLHKMGIELTWTDASRFPAFNQYNRLEIMPKLAQDDTEIHPYNFISSTTSSTEFMRSNQLRSGRWKDECELQSICVFHFERTLEGGEKNGVATGINIEQSRTFETLQQEIVDGEMPSCISPRDRDDFCFICIRSNDLDEPQGTGTFYRDRWPHWFARYVPSHEIGHWLGLCHWGHTGFNKIMMTVQPKQGSGLWNWDIIWRSYAYGFESNFTWKDSRNIWRYILDQWAAPGRCI